MKWDAFKTITLGVLDDEGISEESEEAFTKSVLLRELTLVSGKQIIVLFSCSRSCTKCAGVVRVMICAAALSDE